MSKNLSQMVTDLFAAAKPGEDLLPRIQRLREEMKKSLESEDGMFGKFRGLLESFREIIPEEHQRYQAALKALATTSKLSRQEIVKAVSDQLEELKIVEKGLLTALPGRDQLKALEAKAQQARAEIEKLRETITRFENEEKAALASKAAREKEGEAVERTVRELFANVGEEMAAVRKKLEDLPVEGQTATSVVRQPPPVSESAAVKQENVPASGAPAPAVPVDPKFQRKCPMCGGQFNLLELDNLWQCYNCAYEEPTAGAAQAKSEPAPPPVSEQTFEQPESFAEPPAGMGGEEEKSRRQTSSSAGSQPIRKKNCPACKRKMFWYPEESAWRCTDCGYETRSLS